MGIKEYMLTNRRVAPGPSGLLSFDNITFQYEDRIPPRQFHFTLSDQTKELIAVLGGVPPGRTLTFRVGAGLSRRERERALRGIKDRLLVATKHAPGVWDVRRRQHVYYARRLEEDTHTG